MGRRLVAFALVVAGAGGGCDLYIRPDDPDARIFNDGGVPADAPPLDGTRDAGPLIDGGPGPGPQAPTRAHVPVANGWLDVGPADWSCLGLPRDGASTSPLAVSGRVIDWESRVPIGRQAISAVPSPDPGPALGETFSADDQTGEYSATFAQLPFGYTRYGFRVAASAIAQPINFAYEHYFESGLAHTFDIPVVSLATATQLPNYLGATRDPTRAMVLGDVVDCQGRSVSGALVVMSSMFEVMSPTGVEVATFAATVPNMPVAVNVATNADGRFGVFFLPAETATFLQVWGFRTPQELLDQQLTRLATLRLQLPSNSVATMVVRARQGP